MFILLVCSYVFTRGESIQQTWWNILKTCSNNIIDRQTDKHGVNCKHVSKHGVYLQAWCIHVFKHNTKKVVVVEEFSILSREQTDTQTDRSEQVRNLK